MRNLLPARVRTAYPEEWTSQSHMAIALAGKQTYEGTVPEHVKATRRRRNKAARVARRAGR